MLIVFEIGNNQSRKKLKLLLEFYSRRQRCTSRKWPASSAPHRPMPFAITLLQNLVSWEDSLLWEDKKCTVVRIWLIPYEK